MDQQERSHDLAHLGHIEVLTDKFDESLDFFVDVMGMSLTEQRGDSAYLRGWDDYEHHSLQLTKSAKTGLGHLAFRADSPQALQRRAAIIEQSGRGLGWKQDNVGHGPAYCFSDPAGHKFEIYYETEWYHPPAGQEPSLKNQASRYGDHGIGVRRLDHLSLMAADVAANRKFLVDVVGCHLTEQIIFDDGSEKGAWVTVCNKSYDVAYAEDVSGMDGRLHHITYAVDSREAVLRAADICLDHGVYIETGPHKHAAQQTFFLYVYEPAGNRVEVCNAGARLLLAPDWKPVIWTEAERKKGQGWGLKTIESFHTHGTPPAE